MSQSVIQFRFPDDSAVEAACETLAELEYKLDKNDRDRTLKVYVEGADLQSALEIAQMYGGSLCETGRKDAPVKV